MSKSPIPLEYNPFIHGSSSHTLSIMQSTEFKLLPILTMLQNFKVAPIVGEMTQGGYGFIGDSSNTNSLTGTPAFGRFRNCSYDLEKVISSYTKFPKNNKKEWQKIFNYFFETAHKSAFRNLNLLMIYFVRLRQFGVNIENIAPLSELDTFNERLNATIQFYYFILFIQKHIFIDRNEMLRFRNENGLTAEFEYRAYLEHFFSFENLIDSIKNKKIDVKEIYDNPTPENINKLIEFLKISKNSEQTIKIDSSESRFTPTDDYHIFTTDTTNLGYDSNDSGLEINSGLLLNSDRLSSYLFQTLEPHITTPRIYVPDFRTIHETVLRHITAMQDRITLWSTLFNSADSEFTPPNLSDGLISKPFPVIFVTESTTFERLNQEFRSRLPLALGREILLVATNNKHNQKRFRDYLQENNIGPVEVLLFTDLNKMNQSRTQYFDAFANNDLIRAFELAKTTINRVPFSKLYRALSELNEKRFYFKSKNQQIYQNLNDLFVELQENILTPNKERINFEGIQEILKRNKETHLELYSSHRGVLKIIDTLLTILASLIVFYPIVYLVQKHTNHKHMFFATDTETKINNALRSCKIAAI
jgi:hypothetical protein